MKYFCIIPVRKGSRRFINKNKSMIDGVALFQYSINQALSLFPRSQVLVTTDDKDIMNQCLLQNIYCYQRPDELASDTASTASVLQQVVKDSEVIKDDDVVVLFQATNPLRKRLWVTAMMEIMNSQRYTSVISFSPLKEKKFGLIKENTYIPESYQIGQRSQDIESRYFENGLVYMTKASEIKSGSIFTTNMYPFIIDDICASVDIDFPDDLEFANFLIKAGLYNEDL